ncbi:sterol desaturase family protein [Flavobacterium aquidurense]|uniref:sterol desaturase family protein n=1 Tax=Flavobacterium aquidurense TaxID=362413 RepID=UPI00285AC5F7|nr:sterol desaturase family protein [Flavobacterium aquidurense]MDR7372977.1 sterol desaturase/sphingolipid hydroxylase (fatty acid hydroxylase superfamily) [Flavobacterium aquidurense]
MINLLADLQPLVLILMLVLMYCIENILPYLTPPSNRKTHYRRNLTITFFAIILNGILGTIVVLVVDLTAHYQLGLLNQIQLPLVLQILVGILLLDFGSYLTHNLQHKVPFLWRFHKIHHSDYHLNISSSLRFHPVDVIVSQCVYQCIAVMVIGLPISAFIIYGSIAIPLLIMQHSNVRFPRIFERFASLVFATPGWHKIHHSSIQIETDSHYGDVFTFWDRIFGTWSKKQPHEIIYGLVEYNEDKHHRVKNLMISPFKKGGNTLS